MRETMTLQEVKNFHELCLTVIIAARGKPAEHLMQYARTFAEAGRKMDDPYYIQQQIPYILNNTKTWTGEIARTTKARLKELAS